MAFVLKQIGRFIKAYFIIIGVLTTLFFLGLFWLLSGELQISSSQFSTVPKIEGDSLIHLRWSGTLSNSQAGSSPFEMMFQGAEDPESNLYLPYIENYLERLGEDATVKGLVIELGPLGGGLALLGELRSLLQKFKKDTRKPLYFYLSHTDTKGYYLASVGDEIIMAPQHKLFLLGPIVNSVYFGEALKKLGVGVEVVRTGTYKSAFEPFIANEPSEATRFMYKEFIASVKENLIQELKGSLGNLTPYDLDQAFKTSLFDASEAREAKLITEVSYFHEAKEKYEALHKSKLHRYKDYVLAKASEKKADSSSSHEVEENGIALIEAIGTITSSFSEQETSGNITPHKIIKEIQWAKEDDKVKAVVLRVDSPGGAAAASDLIWEELRLLAIKKPLVVSMGDVAASGGYYISSPAHKIFAGANTITGSIGVISILGNLKGFEEKYGVSFFLHSDSDRKNLLHMGKESSASDKELFRRHSDMTYHEFLSKVSLGRKIPYDLVKQVAEGRIWTGSQAKKLKLVDEIGSLKDALTEAKVLGGFSKNKKVPLLRYMPEIRTLMDCFKSQASLRRCFNHGKETFFFRSQISSLRDLDPLKAASFNRFLEPLLQTREPLAYSPEFVSFE